MPPEPGRPVGTVGSPSAADWQVFREWAEQEGWRVPERELALYRHDLADSAFVMRAGPGEPLGFVTVCRQQRSAWIGNLLVAPARRGEGFGRRLFRHALATLSAHGVTTLWLTASGAGLPLYQSCGFREFGRVERWVSGQTAPSGGGGLRIENGELYELVRADAAAWGSSRAALLTLLARGGHICTSGRTMALLQPGDDLCVLGPWLSADHCPRANRLVLTMALAAVPGGVELAVDLIAGSPERPLLRAAGFRQLGETVLMVRGGNGCVLSGELVALASLGSLG